jgi:heat shock protein HslJ
MEIKMKKLLIGLFVIIVLTACSSRNSISIDGQWRLVSYGSPDIQIPAAPSVETSIEFDSEERMNGNVGCNSFGGDFKVEGDTITFSPVMSTLMFCETVADQESGTLAVLRESATFIMDGNRLTVTSADRNAVVVLERK